MRVENGNRVELRRKAGKNLLHAGPTQGFSLRYGGTIREVMRLARTNITFVSCGGPGSCWAAAKSGAIAASWGTVPFTPIKEKTDYARVVIYAAHYSINKTPWRLMPQKAAVNGARDD